MPWRKGSIPRKTGLSLRTKSVPHRLAFIGLFVCSERLSLTVLQLVLPYLLTPCNRILLQKLTDSQLFKKFPAFYVTRKFITAFTSARTSHFLKINLNIIFPSSPASPKWSFSTRFPPTKLCISLPSPHTFYMPCPSHSSRFYHPNNIW